MAVRKAGDSLLKAAYLAALAKEGRAPGSLGADAMALERRLTDQGSAALGAGDLRALLNSAASPRKTAEMNSAEKLGVIERYLQDSFGGMAPMVMPVQDRAGVYGASVIDGDRLIAHGLARGNDGDENLLFVPAAVPGLTHVMENSASGGPIRTYAGAMSTSGARGIYGLARKEGFDDSYLLMEDWANGPEVRAESGPIVQRLFQKLQQQQMVPSQQGESAPFQIVASRGPGASFDLLGMRQGGRVMATIPVEKGGSPRLVGVSAPFEPGWLGNPWVANDAGGPEWMTREKATELFGELVREKAKDPVWRDAFLSLKGKRVGYYKPDEEAIHLHALQEWIAQNTGA